MCTITDSQIKADGKVVSIALKSIANLLKVTNSNLASDLIAAADGLVAVTDKWTSTSSKALFDDAALVVETVLSLIPVTAVFAPFVAIAVGAIDILIANIGTPSAPVSTTSVRAMFARIEALPPNHWRGQAQIQHRHWHSLKDDFVAAWNDEVDKMPTIGIAKLK